MFLWLRTWLSNTARSAYDRKFYAEMAKKKFPKRFGHLYGALFLTSLFMGTMFAVWLGVTLPVVRTAILSMQRELPSVYPAQLVVTIKKGAVSTNMREPVVIDFPPAWEKMLKEKNAGSAENPEPLPHLLTIDTKGSAEDFGNYESLALLTEHAFVVIDKNNGVRLIPIDKKTDMVITKKFYDSVLAKVFGVLNWLPSSLGVLAWLSALLLPFAFAGLRLLGYLIYLLPMTSVLWVIAPFINRKFSFAELYWLSMYGLTLPLAYGLLEVLLRVHYPWVFSLIFLVWMGYVLKKLPKSAATRRRA